MKRFILCVMMIVCGNGALAAESTLPAPQTSGGMPVFQAIEERSSASGKEFPSGAVSDQDLSTLLWAASGRNRDNKGWTVPTAMGVAPYCTVYVTDDSGCYRYDWKEHSLRKLSAQSIKATVGKQSFVGNSACVLIFVADEYAVGKIGLDGLGEILTGAMTQNVYLAAQSLGIGVRFVASFDEDVIRERLHIKDTDKVVCIMPVGRFE